MNPDTCTETDAMQRDNEGQRFFGFCGQRVYVPDDPAPGDLARRVLERFRQRLAAELSKDKTSAVDKQELRKR